jgi:hypothetical protein
VVSPTLALPSAATNGLMSRLVECESTINRIKDSIQEAMMMSQPVQSTVINPDLNAQVKEVQVLVKQLKQKVAGKGIQIATKTFQFFDKVKPWISLQLPNKHYGLFVDGMSIFELFVAGHIDTETAYLSFYSQHQTGFQSSFEAKVASSVQNLFPTIFGKSDSNVDTAEPLPALSRPEKWDSNDGNKGLRTKTLATLGMWSFNSKKQSPPF